MSKYRTFRPGLVRPAAVGEAKDNEDVSDLQ